MALTELEEAQARKLIEAYNNGKKLVDLEAVAQGTSPYDILCEVVDASGQSKKATFANLIPGFQDVGYYGIEYDVTVSSPDVKRIGNLNLHRILPIQSRMRGCLLNNNGDVVKYLNPDDWTGETLNGTDGQVMVEIPLHYRKCVTDGNKRRVLISEMPLEGFVEVPKCYVSAYEASLNRSSLMLASIKNTSEAYRGGNNNAQWDNTYRSLLGRPVTNLSRTNFRDYARKRKANSAEWNCMTYDIHKALYWLFVIEYATFNSQAGFNAQKDSNGYAQGGLGAGVTTLTSANWSLLNEHNPFVPCGHTDSLGNGSGEVPYEVPNADGAIFKTVMVPRYRGVENPFGHLWKWTDGINVRISPTEANGGDGLSKVYVCSDPSKFKDNGYDGYRHVGNEARAEGYIKEVIFGANGEIMPAAVGAGSTTYFCDYHYTNIPTTEILRGGLFGGNADNGENIGFATANSNGNHLFANTYIGSRLCFIPQS